MPFDYETNAVAVRTVLTNANTTTSNPDLSSGLTRRVVTISIRDPEVTSIRWDELPAVYIRIASGEEDFASLGQPGPAATNVVKFKDVNYEIWGMWMRDGSHSQYDDAITEMYRMAENIEGVFQRNYNISGTALWCNPRSTSFGTFTPQADGARISLVLIDLKARHTFR